MDINELNKKQLILVTLLVTFVVSIGTGIVTVSLMNQAPKIVPQTINNVIQRTIEKVSTSETPSKPNNTNNSSSTEENLTILSDDNVLVSLFKKGATPGDSIATSEADISGKSIGQGVIISDIGLVLVESDVVSKDGSYQVSLGSENYDVSFLKKFGNGFTILKIEPTTTIGADTDTSNPAQ